MYVAGINGTKNPNFKAKSVIKVSDFESPSQLAKFLTDLANDEKRYNSYLQWKFVPPTERFKTLTSQSLDHESTVCSVSTRYTKYRDCIGSPCFFCSPHLW
jgi:hypothetical protein